MKHAFLNIVIIAAILSGCRAARTAVIEENTLPASALLPFGRTTLNEGIGLELVSSAAHFGFSYEGTECTIMASTPYGHNYLQYELDGKYQKRIKVTGTSPQTIVLTAPDRGRHTVWIYKATEAHTGPVVINKVTGRNVQPLQRPNAPLIEFIGNSITCGAAADASEVPCGSGEYHDQHNAYYAYGPRVARALKTNFIVSSVSGIGIYRNWNSDGPAMPQVYEKADFQAHNNQLWNFAKYSPKVVSIALGTNDFSRGDGKRQRLPFDSASFVNRYIKFVQKVVSKYPKAQIALLSSPMARGSDRAILQNCLAAVKQNVDELKVTGKPVALHFFPEMQAHGCTGHPSVEDHELLAKKLVPFFKKLL